MRRLPPMLIRLLHLLVGFAFPVRRLPRGVYEYSMRMPWRANVGLGFVIDR